MPKINKANVRKYATLRQKIKLKNKVTVPASVEELTEVAKKCVGLSTVKKPGKNKGERGQKVENLLGLENTNALTDVSDGDLKTTTLGQTIFISSLGHCLPEIIEHCVEFDASKVGRKIGNCLYVAYDKEGNLLGNEKHSKESHPEHHKKLTEDFNYISGEIKKIYSEKGTLSTINGPNKLLQIRTKASKNSKGKYPPLVYKNHQLKNKYMAFYLLSSFSKELFNKQ